MPKTARPWFKPVRSVRSLRHEDVLPPKAVRRLANVEGGEAVGHEGLLNFCLTAEPERGVGPQFQAVRSERVGVPEGNIRQRHLDDFHALLDLADARNVPGYRTG